MKRILFGLMVIGMATPAMADRIRVGEDGGCKQGAGNTVVCGTRTYTGCHATTTGSGWNCNGYNISSGGVVTPVPVKGDKTQAR